MEIEQNIWGFTAEGEAIVLYKMTNAGGASVKLTNIGATVVSVEVPDRDGRLANVALGYDDFKSYFGDGPCMGKTVGRFANRIRGAKFTLDGVEYRLSANCSEGRHHTHGGGINGFANKIWESRVETDRIVMELPAGDDGLPALAVLFDLDDDGQFAVTHLARGATAAPFTMTTQLFWQGDWQPTLRTQEGPATDDGRFYPVEGWRRNILGEAARLDDPAAGRTIEILTSQPEIRIVRHDGQLALLCGDSRPAPLDDETLYCQKDVYRF